MLNFVASAFPKSNTFKMKKVYLLSCFLVLITSFSFAKYVSPNNGTTLTLDYLVSESNGAVTKVGQDYLIHDTIEISQFDVFSILENATVKFALDTYIHVLGSAMITPPDSVLFTAMDISKGYLGIHLDNSLPSVLQKLIMEYGVSVKITDNSPVIDQCVFRYNNNSSSTAFGSGAINLFRSNPIITNSKFLYNHRSAITGGANIANAPQIYNNFFLANDTDNKNVPQINLGASGADTTKIIGNQIIGAYIMSGGISFLPIGNVNVVISGNEIVKNRYGINLQGGDNINAIVSYNVIDSNNIEGNPMNGGSGIAFLGGSASSHQTTIVTGNLIRANLWGITIQTHATPNLGNLYNADTSDNGKNYFINNTNSSTPGIDLYNNTVYPIFAQGNNWNTTDVSEIENKIFHNVDNTTLGLVDFSNSILPLELVSFSAEVAQKNVYLKWTTATESNTNYFDVERSEDGVNFTSIGKVNAAGNSSQMLTYQYLDQGVSGTVFYRLKMMDKDGKFQYSAIAKAVINTLPLEVTKVYPTAINSNQPITFEVQSMKKGTMLIQVTSADGKLLQRMEQNISPNTKSATIQLNSNLPSGILYLRFVMDDYQKTIPIVKQ